MRDDWWKNDAPADEANDEAESEGDEWWLQDAPVDAAPESEPTFSPKRRAPTAPIANPKPTAPTANGGFREALGSMAIADRQSSMDATALGSQLNANLAGVSSAPEVPGYTKSADPNAVPDFDPNVTQDDTDDARAARGFGRSAYRSGLDGPTIDLGDDGMIEIAPEPEPEPEPMPASDMKRGESRKARRDRLAKKREEIAAGGLPMEELAQAENPSGVGVTRAVTRGALRTTASLPTLSAMADMQALRDVDKPPSEIARDTLSDLGLPPIPETVDANSPEAVSAYLSNQGYPASQVNLFRQSYEVRIEKAADAKANRQIYEDRVQRNLQSAAGFLERAEKIPMSPGAERMKLRLAEDQSVSGTLKVMLENPVEAFAFLGETAAESAPMIAASGAGAVVTRSPIFSATLMSTGAIGQELAISTDEFLREEGFDLRNESDLDRLLQNPDVFVKASGRGLTRGVIIAMAESVGQGVAMRQILQSPIGNTFAQTFVQSITGGGGEYLAMRGAGQEVSGQEVLLEALAEAITAIPEMGVATASQARQPKASPPKPTGNRQSIDQALNEGDQIFREAGFDPDPVTTDELPDVTSVDDAAVGSEAPPPLPVQDIETDEVPDVTTTGSSAGVTAPPPVKPTPIEEGDDDVDLPEGAVPANTLYPVEEESAETEPTPEAETGTPTPADTGTQETATPDQTSVEDEVPDATLGPEIPRRTVKPAIVTTPVGSKVEVEYAVVEADDLIPSHSADGSVNTAYPVELQPRERDRKSSIEQIENIASAPDATQVGEAPFTSDGAPVISADGVVESGNGRVIGIRKAYTDNGTGKTYRADLEAMGFDTGNLRKPILVRVRKTPMTQAERIAFTRDSNKPTAMSMSESERAVADGGALPADVIGLYRGGDIDAAANRDFVRGFVQNVLTPAERNDFMDNEGRISSAGLRRIEAALLAKAYGSPELVNRIVETTDSRIKGIGGALKEIAPRWAQMRREVTRGNLPPEVDLTDAVLEAVNLVDRARREGRNVAEYVTQGSMFGGGGLSPMGENVLSLMFYDTEQWTKPVGKEKLIKAFSKVMDEIEKVGAGEDMFGASPDMAGMLELGEKARDDGTQKQQGLFDTQSGNGSRSDGSSAGQNAQSERTEEDDGASGASDSQGSEESGTSSAADGGAANEGADSAATSQGTSETGDTDAADSGGGSEAGEASNANVTDRSEDRPDGGNDQTVKKSSLTKSLSQEKQDRLADLKKRLADKARNQTSAGIDPEYITIGAEIVSLYVEAGAKRFGEIFRDFMETTGLTAREAQAPMMAAYNYQRDQMQIAGEDVSDMDTSEQVMDEVMRAIAEEDSSATEDSNATETETGGATETTEMQQLAEGFQDAFEDGEAFGSITQARRRAGEILGRTITENDYKEIEEGIEVGVVLTARNIASNANLSVDERYDALTDLYQRQPKLAQRTSQSQMAQAYSTPAPLAYLASRLVDVRKGRRIYEPSAGTGMLLMEAAPSQVTAVEMQPDRVAALDITLGSDATIIEGDATEVDIDGYNTVIANPPFGRVLTDGRGPAKKFDLAGMETEAQTEQIDHAIVARALNELPEDGEAVLLIGGQKGDTPKTRAAGYQSNKNRIFFKKLYDQYNVTEHFTVDGKLYERQGAGWPVDVIVIKGKGKSAKPYPMAVAPELFNNWETLGERLDGTRDSLDTRSGTGSGVGDTAGTDATEADEGTVQGTTDQTSGGDAGSSDAGTGTGTATAGTGGTSGGQSGGTVANDGAVDGGDTTGDGRGGVSVTDGDARDGVAGEAGSAQEAAGQGQNAGNADGGRDRAGGNTNTGVRTVERNNTEVESEYQVKYAPRSNAEFAVGTLTPVNMQNAINSALDELQDKVGDIDDFVAKELGYTREELLGDGDKKGYFSAEQVDALALAIDNVQQGKGFIIGDQTGVGKGRVVAAMLRYGRRKGHIPVFITKDAALYKDMTRDLRDIGEPTDIHKSAFMTNTNIRGKDVIHLSDADGDILESPKPKKYEEMRSQIADTGTLPDGIDMIWTTYDQLKQWKGADVPRHPVMRAIAPKAMFVMDESHMAGGKTPDRAADGAQSVGDFIRELLNVSPNGVVFSSATYAKRPETMSLYAPTDMSLAVESIDQLQGIMEKGGVPIQQVVANMLVESGQYVRRERSFEGVQFGMKQLPVSQDKATVSSEMALQMFRLDTDYMQDARSAFIDHLKSEGMGEMRDAAVGDQQFSNMSFASTIHNLAKQMLLALKTDAVVDEAVEAHKAGQKPIITVSNTNGAIVKEFLEEEGLNVGDTANIPLSAILDRYMERLRRVGYKDENEKTQYVYMTDNELAQFGGPRALQEFNNIRQLIKEAATGDGPLADLSASPIDKLLDGLRDAGVNVEEVTGRNLVISNGKVERREASSATKTKNMADFNSGKLDALVINRSGSTGFSLHARDAADNDGKKRHMIIAQPEENIDDFMQMLGRPHRTGQSDTPIFTIAVSDLAIEKRPAAVLMQKLASLNANTTANRESAVTIGTVVDFLNQYGDRVVLDYLNDNPELAADLDMTSGITEKSGRPVDGLAQKFTNRLTIIPPQRVSEIYDEIEALYSEMLRALDAVGENALEAKTLDLDARTISRAEVVEATDDSSPFGRAAYLEKVDVKRQGRPFTPEELQSIVTAKLRTEDGQQLTADQFVDDQAETLDQAREKAVEILGQRATEYEAELAQANTEKQRERAQDKLNRMRAKIGTTVSTVSDIITQARAMKPGQMGMLSRRMPDGTRLGVPAMALGADLSKLKDNPAAASNIKITIATADAQRQVTESATKFLGEDPDLVFTPEPEANRETFLSAFRQGNSEVREERYIATGNLVSAFSYFDGKGQVTIYTDATGAKKQGILMPANFDAESAIEQRPVRLTPSQALSFLYEGGNAQRIVRTTDGVMTASINSAGQYILRVSSRGKRPYIENSRVLDLIGRFQGRNGAKYHTFKSYDANLIEQVMGIYEQELGISYETDTFRDEARAFSGETTPTMNDTDGPMLRIAGLGDASGQTIDAEPIVDFDQTQMSTTTVTQTYSKRFKLRRKLVFAKLNSALQKQTGGKAKLKLSDALFGEDVRYNGVVSADGLAFRNVVMIALRLGSDNARKTVDHEAVHFLRNSRNWGGSVFGLFTEPEWLELEDMVVNDKPLFDRIKKMYAGETRQVQIEEAIAAAYEEWAAGRREMRGGLAQRAMRKIREFFVALRSALTGNGFTVPAEVFGSDAEQIFADIESGRIGSRSEFIPFTGNRSGGSNVAMRQRAVDDAVSLVVGEKVRFSVTPGATPQQRQRAVTRGLMYSVTNPLETALRLATLPIGGMNDKGQLRFGRWAYDQAAKTVSEREFSDKSYLRFMNPAMRRMRMGLVDRYGQDPEYVERERQKGVDEGNLARKGMEFVQRLIHEDMDPAEYKVIQQILTGEAPRREEWDALTEPIREAVDQLGYEAMMLGLISRESYERNKGEYLHRLYQQYESRETRISKKAREWGSARRQKIVGEQFKGRGMFDTVPTGQIFAKSKSFQEGRKGAPQKGDEVLVMARRAKPRNQGQLNVGQLPDGRIVEKVYLDPNEPIPAAYQNWESLGIHEVRGKKGKDTIIWRDYTIEEREKMGEILDVRYTLAKTFQLMSRDIATGRFFKDIAENDKWARKMPPEGALVDESPKSALGDRLFARTDVEWVKVPTDKVGKSNANKFGALAGMYVRAEIWRDMQEVEVINTPNGWRQFVTFWKLNKTARSINVHVHNIVSNFIFMDMAGIRVRDFVRAVREMRKGGQLYQEALENGAFGADYVTQEIQQNVLDPLMRELDREMRGGKGTVEAYFGSKDGVFARMAMIGKMTDGIVSRLGRGVRYVDQKMINAYQMEDQVFRMATYIRRRQQGLSVQEAAVDARDQFLNYDIRAPWVNGLRNTMLPFLSYTYRAIPRIAEAMVTRPWLMTKYFGMYYAANQLAYYLAPSEWDEDEERGALRDDQKQDTWLGIPFTDAKVPRMIRLPMLGGRDGDLPLFLDMRRWIPAGDVFELNGTTDIPPWLAFGGPIMMAVEFNANYNFYFNEKISDPTDPFGRRAWDRFAHLYSGFMPSYVWGSYHTDRIIDAITKDATRFGGQPYTVREAVGNFMGIKVQPLDVEAGYDVHHKLYDDKMRLHAAEMSSLERQYWEYGRISEEEYLKEMQLVDEKIDRTIREYNELMDLRR